MSEQLGKCDFRQYEHSGPHEQIPSVGQRLPPFGCKNWKPVESVVTQTNREMPELWQSFAKWFEAREGFAPTYKDSRAMDLFVAWEAGSKK